MQDGQPSSVYKSHGPSPTIDQTCKFQIIYSLWDEFSSAKQKISYKHIPIIIPNNERRKMKERDKRLLHLLTWKL